MRSAMVAVVERGTASGLALDGWTVGAKTGTAELTGDGASTNAWVMGFAGPAGQPPALAFAVLIEATDAAGQQTGGEAAVPVAQALLQAARGAVEGRR